MSQPSTTPTFSADALIDEVRILNDGSDNAEYLRGQIELLAWLNVLSSDGDVDARVEELAALIAGGDK